MTDAERNGPEETFHDTERKLRARIEQLEADTDEAYARGFSAGQQALKDTGKLVVVNSPELAELRLALTQSRAETAATVAMLNDADHQYNRRTNDMIARHAAAQAKSRAETAAAYERAAREVDCGGCGGGCYDPVNCAAENAAEIRALATPDQTDALDAVWAEARAHGMREAAMLIVKHEMGTPMHSPPQLLTEAHDRILAAIKGAKA